jgi:hypothetical protein
MRLQNPRPMGVDPNRFYQSGPDWLTRLQRFSPLNSPEARREKHMHDCRKYAANVLDTQVSAPWNLQNDSDGWHNRCTLRIAFHAPLWGATSSHALCGWWVTETIISNPP